MAIKSVTITPREGKPLRIVTRFTGDDERETTRFGGSLAALVLLAEAMNEDAFEAVGVAREDWDTIWQSEESKDAANLCFGSACEVVRIMLKKASPKTVSVLGRALFRVAFHEANGTSPRTEVATWSYLNKDGVRVVFVS